MVSAGRLAEVDVPDDVALAASEVEAGTAALGDLAAGVATERVEGAGGGAVLAELLVGGVPVRVASPPIMTTDRTPTDHHCHFGRLFRFGRLFLTYPRLDEQALCAARPEHRVARDSQRHAGTW